MFRNGHRIASIRRTTYMDTKLTNGAAYSYRVSAYDPARNSSTTLVDRQGHADRAAGRLPALPSTAFRFLSRGIPSDHVGAAGEHAAVGFQGGG